ncbi:MAG: DUF2207 domain-containing protein [Chloroflexi bacterium]|nr:DUF2207 domain-containing protein [Chloroflexota bacterium]
MFSMNYGWISAALKLIMIRANFVVSVMSKVCLVAFWALVLFGLSLVGVHGGVCGEPNEYFYGAIDVDINILPNSDMDITETIKIVYTSGTFHYADRWIPMDRVESITGVEVWEGEREYGFNPKVRRWIAERKESGKALGGDSYAYATWVDGGKFWIGWWYPATSGGSRTFTIKYTVRGGLRIGEKDDQLYWKAVFKDHDVPIGRSRTTIHLPEGVYTEPLKAFSYGTAAERSMVDDRTIQFVTGVIPSHQELEVQVFFPHGIVSGTVPVWQADLERHEAYNAGVKPKVNLALVLLGVIVLIAGGLWLWNVFRGRVRVPRSSFAPPMVYSPPDDLPPALVGLLTKNAVGANELVATIFDLAQKRVIAIAQAERKKFFFSSKDVMLSRSSGITKHSFERLVADALASGNGTWLSEQRGRLPELLRDFSSRVEQESVRQGLFQEEPSKSKGRLSKPGLFMLFVTPFVGIPLVLWLFERAEMIFVPFVSVLLVGLATIILSSKMSSVTEVGATQAGLWKGFGRYLKKMVKDKSLAVDNVSYWDSYFPYAVIFGLSKGWVTTFEGLGANAPVWFHVAATDSGGIEVSGTSMPSLESVSSAFQSMVNSINSGFGSGGTSGGGGGGGGSAG